MSGAGTQTAVYYPEFFDTRDIESARAVILADEGLGVGTDERWEIETPYTMELIDQSISPTQDMAILDYGCGIGRLSKTLINTYGCQVIGVDTSRQMREMALTYVDSMRFSVYSPDEFDGQIASGVLMDAAISVWVLQHCFAPADDIDRIRRGLASDGRFFVLNMPQRAIPAIVNDVPGNPEFIWGTDSVDVQQLLLSSFDLTSRGVPDKSRAPHMVGDGVFWMNLRRTAD
jgi:SAM-dependent methyltransferase